MTLHISGASSFVPPSEHERAQREPDAYATCCAGAAMFGIDRCTCWEPVYDLEQQPLANGGIPPDEIPTAMKCCHDCAYRNGSPERSDEDGQDHLMSVAYDVRFEFWCHQGVRRIVSWRHSDGRVLPAGVGNYAPPIGPNGLGARSVVWRADGTVADRCAGWAAHRGLHLHSTD